MDLPRINSLFDLESRKHLEREFFAVLKSLVSIEKDLEAERHRFADELTKSEIAMVEARDEIQSLRESKVLLEQKVNQLSAEVFELRNSKSWKLTAGCRLIYSALRQNPRKRRNQH